MGVEAEVKQVLKDRAVPFPDHRGPQQWEVAWGVLERVGATSPHPSHFLSRRVSVSKAAFFLLQRPGDRNGGQLDLHRPAPLPGRDHGLGDDRAGDPGAGLW